VENRTQISASLTFERYCFILVFRNVLAAATILFIRKGVEDLINLQSDGNLAKPYQVKQVRRIMAKYGLGGED